MRRSRFYLTSALAAVGLSALPALAQQSSRAPGSPGSASSAPADAAADPSMAARPARYLLQNGLDYLSYREYDRALNFFRAIEKRQDEMSDAERQKLRQGIARAQQGKREAVNGPHVVANPKGRPSNPPGSFALAKPAATARAATARRPMAAEPVQLTSGTMVGDEVAPAPAEAAAAAPSPAVVVASEPAPLDLPPAAAVAPAPIGGPDLPSLPTAPPAALPDLTTPPPGAEPAPIAAEAAPMPILPEVAPAPTPEPAPAPELPAVSAVEPAAPPELPTLGAPMPVPVAADPAPADPISPPASDLPSLPQADAPAPAPAAAPTQDPATIPAQAPAPPEPQPRSAPEPPPVAEAPPASSEPVGVDPDRPMRAPIGSNSHIGSLLTPGDNQEIARIAQRTTDNPAGDRASAANPTNDPNGATGPVQGSTRLELQRAPSPTEARPIRAIAVPEEFVPLGRRDWTPNRKYWAAAGTCHMILYFQDPVLERYGQGVEQSLGPVGRYFSYPLDDPKQSNQRNQILQPFYSIGKFCFQVGTLPYKLVVDPPWEAEYDLGYYRPGDKIPPDTIMITPTGVGPPLKGRRY